MNQVKNLESQKSNREWWVDYLRVIAVFLVIPFHVIISYVQDAMGPGLSFLIWNNIPYEGARFVFEFFNPWQMQLLFALAGFSMVFSLRKRNYGKFTVERVLRLGIPIFLGLFIWNALMGWYSTLFVYEVYPYPWVNPIYPDLPSFGMYYRHWWIEGKMINTGHLWFMVVLLILSLIIGGIVSIIRKTKVDERKWSNVLVKIFTHPVAVIFWALCAVFIKYIPPLSTFPRLSQVFSVFQYNQILFFIYGILLASNTDNLKKLQKIWMITLPIGVIFIFVWVFLMGNYPTGILNLGISMVRNLGAWSFVNGLIGVSSKYLKKPTRGIKYFSKAGAAVYILHLPLEIMVGYYLIRNPLNPVLEIFMLIGINFALCLAIYEIVRQINKIIPGIGYLLGIKEKQIWRKSRNQKIIEEVTHTQ